MHREGDGDHGSHTSDAETIRLGSVSERLAEIELGMEQLGVEQGQG